MADHESCRRKVCVICIRKATRDRSLSEADIKSIRDYVIPDYDVTNLSYPCGLCNTCYFILNKKRRSVDIALPIKHFSPDQKRHLRSSVLCSCTICMVAKAGPNMSRKLKKKKGRPNNVTEETSTPNVIKLCSTCLSRIYQGCRHLCSKYRYRLAAQHQKNFQHELL